MYLDYLVPSWHEIESRVIAMVGYQSGGQFRTSLNKDYQDSIQDEIESELRKLMDPAEAQKVAIEKTKNHMLATAALHNPDLVAGGRDAISDFGARQVNSIIGPQWKTKILKLKKPPKERH
ncbi:polymorphic toxin type 15 domain-containing protein [Pseudomonas asiatica]|uniref:Polymorphic toxin type 15 domain-containing protein n=1 Tax=Pseudomonas asiatica TaxID=2219225 RepID=A0ABU5KZ74_9PSED|nr:polymorphic toxin type 15 domain-containing protein [Pseudomonas asiatica]MDZ5739209.1 polymorphic toxin type 15 domain-containing protein [Pseudomonas asiatica]MDZ5742399.1 polymorphic toxin type 15 domain-containing protein [Pseudomonas asiatica]MDZ5749469.1 polymorphic toxin type 15 domain-containing protein [Pseudomonas asiatica]MDZ5755398.1 polymorphic toxin type 15 domain-containing protein [Pseudomonas asiatica]